MSQVTAASCTSCLECLAACPPKAAALTWGPPGRLARRWPAPVVIAIALACISGAVAASHVWPLPSFVYTRGQRPAQPASFTLQVSGVNCRHSAQQFFQFLTSRSDELRVRGYVRAETWPAPAASTIRITYDRQTTSEDRIRDAITEPVFDERSQWRVPPYRIEE